MSSRGSDAEKATNVQVAVRVRPTNEAEKQGGQPTIVTSDTAARQINVSYGPSNKKFSKCYSFDKVFGMYSTQSEVFDTVAKPIVDEVCKYYLLSIYNSSLVSNRPSFSSIRVFSQHRCCKDSTVLSSPMDKLVQVRHIRWKETLHQKMMLVLCQDLFAPSSRTYKQWTWSLQSVFPS